MNTKTLRKSIVSFLILTFISTNFTSLAFAQKRKAATPNKQQTAKLPMEKSDEFCEGWKGKITYTQNINDERFNNKGEFGYEKYTRVVQITGEVTVPGGKSGAAKVSVLKRDILDTEDRRRNDCGNWNTPVRKNTFVDKYYTQTEETGEATGSVPVTVNMRDGSYNFDISMPAARGKLTMQGKHSQKGYCDASADNQEDSPPVEQSKEFESLRIYAEGTYDPKNPPNVLRGSVKYDPNITITWDLTRVAGGECDDGDLTLSDLKLEQHVFPNKTAWQEVSGNTVDGNQVRVTATVANGSKKTKSGTLEIRENKSGAVLKSQSVSVAPGGEAKVEFVWDTSGYAWTEKGKKASDREIEATVGDDSLRQEITVIPKPVVLVHGLWSNAEAWSAYQSYLDRFNDEWKAFPVGADPAHGKMNTGVMGTWAASNSIFDNAQELGKQIKFTQESMNAWHVDLVAHSMGGLISRFYIHSFMPTDSPDGKPYITHLVMLGTPNMGSPCADLADGMLDPLGKPVEALRQLKPSEVAKFNSQTTNRKGVKFSIYVGTLFDRTCQAKIPGDGVVSIPSATWEVKDRDFIDFIHTDLTGLNPFLIFVQPRLAIGPKKAAQTASLESEKNDDFAFNLNNKKLLASVNPLEFLADLPAPTADAAKIAASKNVKIKAGETAEVPVTFQEKMQTGATFVASPNITVSLIDSNGETVEKIEAGSAQAAEMFKTFYADGKTGNYALRFENTGERDESAFVAVWTDTNRLKLEFVEIQAQADGSIKMQAELTDGGAAVKGAMVSAKTSTDAAEISLFDDGKHGDGAANDGVYGGISGKLPDGNYLIQANAVVSGATVSTATVLSIGAK